MVWTDAKIRRTHESLRLDYYMEWLKAAESIVRWSGRSLEEIREILKNDKENQK